MTVLSPDELATLLRHSRRWVYDHANELGGVRIGGAWIFLLRRLWRMPYKEPDGTWRAVVRIGGRRVAQRRFQKKGDAKEWEREEKKRLLREQDKSNLPCSLFFAKYLEWCPSRFDLRGLSCFWWKTSITKRRRNRYSACQQCGVEPRSREWEGEGSLVEFVVSLNLHRRHLTEAQRSMIGAKVKPRFEDEAKKRQEESRAKPGEQVGKAVVNLPPRAPHKSRDDDARVVNVSPRSIESASKVLEKGAPEVIQAVEAGTLAVSAARAGEGRSRSQHRSGDFSPLCRRLALARE